jgi:hypothetical protein
MNKLIVSILVAAAAAIAVTLAVANPFGAGAGHTSQTKLIAELTATNADPLASGKTKWEERFDGAVLERRRTSTEVEDVATTGDHEVRVTRNGTPVATMTVAVDALGFGDLNLDSRDGDTVEVLAEGDLVEVLNPTGEVILTGTLELKQ